MPIPPESFSERFARICSELPDHLGAPVSVAPPSLHETTIVDIELEDFRFTVIYSPVDSPSQIVTVCRLGPLPQSDQEQVLRRLLELSFFLAGTEAGVGMDPAGDDVLVTLHLPIGAVTVATLVQSLKAQAKLGVQWRENHFMGMQ
jgi:hypothetical protein